MTPRHNAPDGLPASWKPLANCPHPDHGPLDDASHCSACGGYWGTLESGQPAFRRIDDILPWCVVGLRGAPSPDPLVQKQRVEEMVGALADGIAAARLRVKEARR